MNTYELVGINLIFLVSSVLIVLMLGGGKSASPSERALRRDLLVGFAIIQGFRWIPFLLLGL